MGAQTAKTSPPSGTGHVPGFGESFNINLNTGQGVYSYKIALPEGVAKHSPSLTLEYSSAHEYGNYGWGWDIGIRHISRKLDSGTDLQKEIYMDSGQEILPMPDGSFRNRFESQHNRYDREGDGWVIRERNGVSHVMGSGAGARLHHPRRPDRIFKWLVEKTIDTCGNEIRYTYLLDEHCHYLDTIEYAIYRIKFQYESRPDIRTSGRTGFLSTRKNRCKRITLQVASNAVFTTQKTWTFEYAEEPVSGISILRSILLKAHGEASDGSGDVLMPPVIFQYHTYDPGVHNFDFVNSEGQDPPPLSEDEASLINMDNNPLPGVLYNQNGSQLYWENDGDGTWRMARPVKKVPFVDSFAQNGTVFGDMDASGNADMLIQGPNTLNGYYENKGDMQWSNFVAYPRASRSFPSPDTSTRFVDIDGNGVVDAIQSRGRAFHVLKNQRKKGWEAAALIGKTATEISEVNFEDLHYHMADMTGDGLMDIVKVGSGRIDYWPSLGNGRYGDQQTMFNSPRMPRLADHLEKCFFFDCNGSGCADLVFYSGDSFNICYNKNGSRFTAPIVYDFLPPPMDGPMQAIDFYGNGKTGLLYNTRSAAGLKYAYVTFGSTMTGFNLEKVVNGFGLESDIEYKPAIDYYKMDRALGRKWKTHFPFPLKVVSGIKETDVVTGLVSENNMIYHDPHFNADLRQFQGFGEVEKTEKGDDSCPDKKLVYHYLMGQEFASGNGANHAAINGKLEKVETFAMDGTGVEHIPYTIETSEYKLVKADPSADGQERVSVYLDTYTQTHLERSDDRRVEEKKYRYDAFGNVTVEAIRAFGVEDGQVVPEISSEIRYQYAMNEARWILDRVSVVSVVDASGKVTGETRKYYDGQDFIGLDLGKVEKGLEVREARFVMHKTPFKAHYGTMDLAKLGYYEEKDQEGTDAIFMDFKLSKYDAKGVRTGEKDALGSLVEIQFDETGLFREKYTSSLGENVYETDKLTGNITRIAGPDGSVLRMQYDAMGRLLHVFSPDNESTVPSRSYSFDDSRLPFKRVTRFFEEEDLNKFSKVITYFDGSSKEIQNRIQSQDGKFAVSEYKIMNPQGKAKTEFQPYFSTVEEFEIPETAIHPHQTFDYDVLARPVRTVNFFGGISTAEYSVFSVITSDPIDNETNPELVARGLPNTPKIERFNVLRDRTETILKLENNQETKVRYKLSDWGQLEAIEDDKGTVASYVYDHQGNRLVVDHREAGMRKVWYNALKQPVKGEDANGSEISAEYDHLNRITRLLVNGTEVETYTYDTEAQNAVGRLAAVSYDKGRETFTYDANGQLTEKAYDFADRTDPLVLKYAYDRIGRRTAIEHADGTTINYEFTPNGWVKRIPGIVKSIEYDAMGNPLVITYENDVVTNYTFFDGGRKIKTQHTVNKNNQVLENLEYDYLSNGSLLRYTDKTSSQTITHRYEYNALNELTEYGTEQNGVLENHPYEYADHLNLRSMGDNGLSLFRDHVAKPAHISKIRDRNGKETILNYDDNGNL
ncbi:MAG TPA: SpvB/TcaC N-terminal domain-containing protein, partial [Eudoraea sp.]|nr:SpvB/TcaC N-terminal domain-containing protein [Eudoraea sp.]